MDVRNAVSGAGGISPSVASVRGEDGGSQSFAAIAMAIAVTGALIVASCPMSWGSSSPGEGSAPGIVGGASLSATKMM